MIDRLLRNGGCVAASLTLFLAGCMGAEDPTTGASDPTGDVTTKQSAINCGTGQPCVTKGAGPVLSNLKIVNVFMSSDWDSDNNAEGGIDITRDNINTFTDHLVHSTYFADAMRDYGISSVSFGGAFDATGASQGICVTPSLGGITDFAGIFLWITCMASAGPIPATIDDIGLRATNGNIPVPDDGTLYVIYVPKGTDVTDFGFGTCDDFNAFHFMNDVNKWVWKCGLECAFDFCSPVCCTPFCGPGKENQRFAYAVIPAQCSGGLMANLTQAATHEIMEAAVDPIVSTGWIDRTSASFLINDQMLEHGEIVDICDDLGAPPVPLTDGNLVSQYWSTSAGKCVPNPTVTAKCKDVTVQTSATSCTATASVNNGSSDPTGAAVTLTQSPPGPYGPGTTTVTLTVSSSASASATCTGNVTVQDKTPPVFTSVPGPVVAVIGTTPNLGMPTATDACGAVTITNNAPAPFPIGVTTVTWTARDAAGNTATATQTVTMTCAGGPGSCPNGNGCQTGGDCGSKACTGGTCVPPTCAPHCTTGAPCGANVDCGSQVCIGNTCRAPACAPRCVQGAICGDNSHCSSFVCNSTTNRCAPSNCSPTCMTGAPCGATTDCSSRVCTNGLCAPPACSPRCGRGARCADNSNCTSHVCSAGFCT